MHINGLLGTNLVATVLDFANCISKDPAIPRTGRCLHMLDDAVREAWDNRELALPHAKRHGFFFVCVFSDAAVSGCRTWPSTCCLLGMEQPQQQ